MRFGRGSLSVEVSLELFNPLCALWALGLSFVALALGVFAIFTTSIALTALGCRAAIVAVDLGIAIMGAYISPAPSDPSLSQRRPSTVASERPSPPRSRKQRSHAGSTSSLETIVPGATRDSTSLNNVVSTSGLVRDFEGVGGWRTPGDDDEGALWMSMNSRLQIPIDDATPGVRRHQRNHTGGSTTGQRVSWSPETLRKTPTHSRPRTPVNFAADDDDDYFQSQPSTSVRHPGSTSEPGKRHHRRKSSSSSSRTSISALTTKEDGD